MDGKLIVLWLLIICLAADAGRKKSKKKNEVNVKGKKPNCAKGRRFGCTKMLRPVCGSDGVTYNNECVLCTAMQEIKEKIMIAKNGIC